MTVAVQEDQIMSNVPSFVGDCKVLVVGAGGIGCELLKNLVLTGFRHLHVVDLDTIELSNLNRQFLFRRHHIGQSKAIVARESVLRMAKRPEDVNITAHFANIMDTGKFSIEFFKGFDIVMNALDNRSARSYVNNMCLAVNVPLIESGTAGYFGQTSVIINRKTECFDCQPKETPKTFPVCTIRSTPTALIHCVVWAKEFLLPNLFGPNQSTGEAPNAEGEADSEKLKDSWLREQETFDKLRGIGGSGNSNEYFEVLMRKVFEEDIGRLVALEDLWKSRVAPIPLNYEKSVKTVVQEFNEECMNDQEVWPVNDWISLFKSSIERLIRRAFPSSDSFNEVSFDKDDLDTLDFVAAAANIRANIFNISLNSRFGIKAMAGNIIPAIATTNAIAAGMIVIQALNVLQDRSSDYCNAFITYGASRRNIFVREEVCEASKSCSVCSVDRAILTVNCGTFVLKSVVEGVLPKYSEALIEKYGVEVEIDEEDVSLLESSRFLYDIDMDGNAKRSLDELAVKDSKFLKVDIDGRRPLLLAIVNDDELVDQEFKVTWDLLAPKVQQQPEEEDLSEQVKKKAKVEAESVKVIEDDDVTLIE